MLHHNTSALSASLQYYSLRLHEVSAENEIFVFMQWAVRRQYALRQEQLPRGIQTDGSEPSETAASPPQSSSGLDSLELTSEDRQDSMNSFDNLEESVYPLSEVNFQTCF